MHDATAKLRGLFQRWNAIPLYLRIVVALVAGVGAGLALGQNAWWMEIPARIVLQFLGALAPPLILIAVTHVLMTTELRGQQTLRMCGLLFLNTTVAILVGLTVANLLRPGEGGEFRPPPKAAAQENPLDKLLENVPRSLLGPLGDKQNVIGVILIAIAFGVALRGVRDRRIETLRDLVDAAYQTLVRVLHWIIQLVPIGVFAIVARVVGTQGFAPFKTLGSFVLAVLLALVLQATWYLVRIRLGSWVRPLAALRGMRDSLLMAFSTSSSTATMPVTYACLKDNVGVREESASMGALVGANFNNDGTALYEAMSALFVAQAIGQHLDLHEQFLVVLTSIIASVGAAGIPEAGLVTMTLVFNAVGLPTEYIALLLTVDWFLDRSRTTINVLGDVNVACLLDGRVPPSMPETSPAA
jgi:Na+/H+-dicarboxylate symporter